MLIISAPSSEAKTAEQQQADDAHIIEVLMRRHKMRAAIVLSDDFDEAVPVLKSLQKHVISLLKRTGKHAQ